MSELHKSASVKLVGPSVLRGPVLQMDRLDAPVVVVDHGLDVFTGDRQVCRIGQEAKTGVLIQIMVHVGGRLDLLRLAVVADGAVGVSIFPIDLAPICFEGLMKRLAGGIGDLFGGSLDEPILSLAKLSVDLFHAHLVSLGTRWREFHPGGIADLGDSVDTRLPQGRSGPSVRGRRTTGASKGRPEQRRG